MGQSHNEVANLEQNFVCTNILLKINERIIWFKNKLVYVFLNLKPLIINPSDQLQLINDAINKTKAQLKPTSEPLLLTLKPSNLIKILTCDPISFKDTVVLLILSNNLSQKIEVP